MSRARGGRRPGNPDTRTEILEAAREAFREHGFKATTVRGVAAAAAVDPAMIHHYFGSKRELFLAVIEPPADPVTTLAPILDVPRDEVGEHLVRTFLGVWDGPGNARAVTLLRSAVTDESTAVLLREFLVEQVISPVLRGLDVPGEELALRAGLLATQMIGLAMVRHVVHIEPIDRAQAEDLVRAIAPTVQRYITAPL